ncbi:MAG: hypothetical protein JWR27_759 [Aeromicrobium sp.]|jgi:hypothetical protein|nr:hypothetical protein [Aeromicrobium sp.]
MFEIQGGALLAITVVLFILKAFALVDCVARPAGRFTHADTLPKKSWLIILVIALAAHLVWLDPLNILNLVGTVAALVYLAQLRGSSH